MLQTLNIQTNFSISGSNHDITRKPTLPLGWIVLDGTNRTLEEIRDKKVAACASPEGGRVVAIAVSLQRLEPYCRTQLFLIDLETGKVYNNSGVEQDFTVPINHFL